MASISTISPSPERTSEGGLAAGVAAYVLWGFLPLLFGLLRNVGAMTIVADRTVWSLLVVGFILIVGGRTAEVRAALRDRAAVARMALGAFLLAGNWLIYVFAVETGQVLEASFGYFINPLVNVAIGMLLLGEKQNRWQVLSIAIAVVALAIQAIGLGHVPYIALSLALSFAAYGYIRKTAKASSTTGLFIETLVLTPLALAYLFFTFMSQGSLGPHADPYTLTLLILTGPGTALPLLLFAFSVQRLRLTTIGMLQYIAPSIAFMLAVTVFGEHLNATRLVSFGLIWLSLIVFSLDSYLRHRRSQAAR